MVSMFVALKNFATHAVFFWDSYIHKEQDIYVQVISSFKIQVAIRHLGNRPSVMLAVLSLKTLTGVRHNVIWMLSNARCKYSILVVCLFASRCRPNGIRHHINKDSKHFVRF